MEAAFPPRSIPTAGSRAAIPTPIAAARANARRNLTFDAEKGFGLAGGMALTVRVGNLFNDRYFVTYFNAQGNHEAPPRTLEVGLRLNTK